MVSTPLDETKGRDHVPVQISNRVIEADLTRRLASQMKDRGDPSRELLNRSLIGDIPLDELNLRCDVLELASREVVNPDDAHTIGNQSSRECGADEPRSAGDQHRLHGLTLRLQPP